MILARQGPKLLEQRDPVALGPALDDLALLEAKIVHGRPTGMFAAGGQAISSSLKFWGVEGNGLYRAITGPEFSVSVLAGMGSKKARCVASISA